MKHLLLFALIALAYGVLQVYVAGRAATALGWRGRIRRAAYAWALFMALAPFALWWLEHCEVCTGAAAWAAGLVYGWMGYSFVLFWLLLARDLYTLAARMSGLPRPGGRRAFVVLAGVALALSLYGVAEALRPRVEHLQIYTAKLPPEVGRLRIVQITDVHLGMLMGPRRFGRILDQVRALQPDLLLSTGDLVDGRARHLDGLAPLIEAYRPRLGKYAVTGNHEYIVGIERAVDFHERAGLTLLRGSVVEPVRGLVLAGVDDIAAPRFGQPGTLDEGVALAGTAPDAFVILLKHQPVLREAARGRFDLQLSGHVHGGQIFPFGLLVRLVYPVRTGLNPLADGAALYVSRGTGTWGPPMRLLAPPEITLIELIPATEQGPAIAL